MTRGRATISEEERKRLLRRAQEERRLREAGHPAGQRPVQESPDSALTNLAGSSRGVELVEQLQQSSGNASVQRSIEQAREEEARSRSPRRPDRSSARERERRDTAEQEERPAAVSRMTSNLGEEYQVAHAPSYVPGTMTAETVAWQNDPEAAADMAARRLNEEYIAWLGDAQECRPGFEIPATWYLTAIPESEWSLNDWIERRAQGQAIDRMRWAPYAAEYAINLGKLVKDLADEGVDAIFSLIKEEAIDRLKAFLIDMGVPEDLVEALDEMGELAELVKEVIQELKSGNPAVAAVTVLEFILDKLTPEGDLELPAHLDDSGWWGSVARSMPQRIFFYNNVVYNESNLREFLAARDILDESIYHSMREWTDHQRREEVPVPEQGLRQVLHSTRP